MGYSFSLTAEQGDFCIFDPPTHKYLSTLIHRANGQFQLDFSSK